MLDVIDRVIERRHINRRKYPADVLPLWVADMDFPSPEPVVRALRERAKLIDRIGWRGAWATLGTLVIVVRGGGALVIKNAPEREGRQAPRGSADQFCGN